MIRIKQLRQEERLSLRELSSKLNITYSSLGKYERGEQQPSIENLIKIAEYFNVSTDYLIGKSTCKDNSNLNIQNELHLSEEAILILKKYTATKYTLGDKKLILSDTLDKVVVHPSFTKILKLLATFSHYTEDDWNAISKKLSTFTDDTSDTNYEITKSLIMGKISKEFDLIIHSLFNSQKDPFN